MSKNSLSCIPYMTAAVLLIGFPALRWDMGIASRYSFVVVASTVATIMTCEVFIQGWSVARFLFRMKPGRGLAKREQMTIGAIYFNY